MNEIRRGRVGFYPALESRRVEAALLLSFGVLFLLLLSTVDAVWLDRGSFTGASFDFLAGLKLLARAVSVAFAVWLLSQMGPGRWLLGDPGMTLLGVFFLYAAATSAYSAQPILSVTRALSFLGILFFAVVLVRYLVEAGRFDAFWQGLYLTMGVYVTTIFLASLALDAAGIKEAEGRLASLYGPNGAASLSGLVFIWSFVRIAQGEGRRLALFFLLGSGAFVVLALSRGAMVTVLAACAGYAVWRRKSFVSMAVVLGVIGLVLAITVTTGPGVEGVAEFFTRGHSVDRIQAMNGRVPVYGYLLFEQFPQYPAFGVGFQMLSETGLEIDMPAHLAVRRGLWLPGHAHNALLQVLIGTGVVGLVLFVAAWAFILRGIVTRVRIAAPRAYDAIVPLTAFILANSMVETTLTGTIDPNYLVAMLIGATTAATRPRVGAA